MFQSCSSFHQMSRLTSLPAELTLLILENVLCCPKSYEKDLLYNKRHACHHHNLSHSLATPLIDAAACKISLTSRRMRDESKGIIQKFKKRLKEEFEEWRDAWILGERECECLCEEGCHYCELPGLLDMDRLEELIECQTLISIDAKTSKSRACRTQFFIHPKTQQTS